MEANVAGTESPRGAESAARGQLAEPGPERGPEASLEPGPSVGRSLGRSAGGGSRAPLAAVLAGSVAGLLAILLAAALLAGRDRGGAERSEVRLDRLIAAIEPPGGVLESSAQRSLPPDIEQREAVYAFPGTAAAIAGAQALAVRLEAAQFVVTTSDGRCSTGQPSTTAPPADEVRCIEASRDGVRVAVSLRLRGGGSAALVVLASAPVPRPGDPPGVDEVLVDLAPLPGAGR